MKGFEKSGCYRTDFSHILYCSVSNAICCDSFQYRNLGGLKGVESKHEQWRDQAEGAQAQHKGAVRQQRMCLSGDVRACTTMYLPMRATKDVSTYCKHRERKGKRLSKAHLSGDT